MAESAPCPPQITTVFWDKQTEESVKDVRLALGFDNPRDVMRLAIDLIPDIVLGLAERNPEQERITAFDAYAPTTGPTRALTQLAVLNGNVEKFWAAAKTCGKSYADFGHCALTYLAEMERQLPYFVARVKEGQALEDLNLRKRDGDVDIQPWGEVDYRDYGLPDET